MLVDSLADLWRCHCGRLYKQHIIVKSNQCEKCHAKTMDEYKKQQDADKLEE